jgi:hypothetical protein
MVPNSRVVEVLDRKLIEGGRERQEGAADMKLSHTKHFFHSRSDPIMWVRKSVEANTMPGEEKSKCGRF